MKVDRLIECLSEIEEKDAEILGLKFFAGKAFVDCILPFNEEMDEPHKCLFTYFFNAEKE